MANKRKSRASKASPDVPSTSKPKIPVTSESKTTRAYQAEALRLETKLGQDHPKTRRR